jgi:lysophospholipase L1-like esterase
MGSAAADAGAHRAQSLRRDVARAALPALLALLAAWALQSLALQAGNTLHANGRWESTKVGLDHGILGAVSFVATRTALHRRHLDLGVWHGFHELLLRDPVRLERLSLRFRLRSGGWLAVISAHDGERFDALRVSADPDFPPACLAGTAAGAFTAKRPVALPDPGRGWHSLALVREGDALRVELDGAALARCPVSLPGPARVGLRGSAADHVEVDDVRVESSGPPGVLVEDFANHRRAGVLFAALLAAVAALDGAVALRVSRRGGAAAPALAAVNLVVLLCAGLALLADAVYFGRLHPERIDFAGFENRIEYEAQITRRLAREYPLAAPPPGVRRILVLGTSQTWGSGAARPEDVWVRRLEAGLAAGARLGERFELIDAGLPGDDAEELRESFAESWVAWRPELVLVNLGNNDRDPERLARELERIAEIARQAGSRVAFIPEPNCTESRSEKSLRGLLTKHAAMRAVATRLAIPVVEVHGPLAAERDGGFLWWDRVHLTSYGQERLAKHLLEARSEWLDAGAGKGS